MTVIAVRKYEDRIELAADSQATWGSDYKILTKTKLVQTNDFTFGCAGSGRDIALFRMFARTHKPKAATEDDIVDFLAEFVSWKKQKASNEEYVGQMILVMDCIIFEIEQYSVREPIETFFAVGSGMFTALGAMELGASPKSAVEVCVKYNLGCGGDVKVITIPLNTKKEEKS